MSIRAAVLLTCLVFAPAALAEETAAAQLEEKRAEVETLRAARDAALVRANIYQLPKDKLEAQAKQEQIDALEAEIAALEKQGE